MPMLSALLSFSQSDAPAYRCTEGILTFRQLVTAAQRLGSVLLARTKPGEVVAIYGHKQLLIPICIVACALTNRPYLPIDRQTPFDRAAAMLRQGKIHLLLAAQNISEIFAPLCEVLKPDELRAILSDSDLPLAEAVSATPDDIFYLLFTSGSSGAPKGVQVTRGNAASFLHWERGFLETSAGPVLNQAAFSFDLSVADLWLSLTSGRCEAALEQSLFGNYPALFTTIATLAPTLAVLTPSFAELLLASSVFNAESFPSLRELLFCGEPLRIETVRRLFVRFPALRIINSYGPTECTVAVSACVITKQMLCNDPLPIGFTKPGVLMKAVDSALYPLPDGKIGEILIAGNSVAAGYLGESSGGFCNWQGLPAYRTGDLGYKKGELWYCHGRLDRQIKLRGIRIEPEDIEQNLCRVEGVAQAAVLPTFSHDGQVRRLRAFVTPLPGVLLEPEALREMLCARLPIGMIPAVTILSQLPLTKNGKCDYAALEELL